MITHPAYAVEPWSLRETRLDLDLLAHTESVFTLANGHLGMRGNLDEGEPAALPGTYLNGFYELRPLPYAEAGYGYPESGQTVVNVTDGKIIRLLVDDEPFDLRYGELIAHERLLDFRAGLLCRHVEWRSPAGQAVRVSSTRLVSFSQRAVAAVRYEVEPLGEDARIVLQSELVANEPVPAASNDPRAAAALAEPLVGEYHFERGGRVLLVHSTRSSGLRMAAAMDHVVRGPEGTETQAEAAQPLGRFVVTADLEPGQRLCMVKFLSYGWSSQRSLPAVRDQVDGALAEARHTGWDGLVAAQRAYLDDFWDRADVAVDGDTALQQAVRFALFHTLQAGARAEGRAIGAKGLTGTGYDGHTFWDQETFVLPLLTYTVPDAARDTLRWRHATLPKARARAAQLGHAGAAFPWRTIAGEECSGYWPAGTAAFHIDADIADAVRRYLYATGDEAFERSAGVELLVETARLWRSLGHHDAHGRFRIDGVTGPDEYSALADNNVYTNLMAQSNLIAAADSFERHPDRAAELGVDAEEAAAWRDAAHAIVVPYNAALGVHEQSEGFTSHQVWDFAATSPEQYPLLLHFPYFDLYRRQVVKQADLVLAMHLRGAAFSDEEKARNFAYYEALTVRDSSLSAATQAVVAAEVGHLGLAYDYLAEAALIDLEDRHGNTRDGLHIASLAGTWFALVAGLGGMRDDGEVLSFRPRLPEALDGICFRVLCHNRRLVVDVRAERVRYSLAGGGPLEIEHEGERIRVSTEHPVERPLAHVPALPRPQQPAGRAPLARRRER